MSTLKRIKKIEIEKFLARETLEKLLSPSQKRVVAFSMEAFSIRAIKEMNAKKVPLTPFWDVKQNDFKTLELFNERKRGSKKYSIGNFMIFLGNSRHGRSLL